ncbi:hypothetical protein ACWEF6_13445 [Amycolatopsis sp. NPDC004772]
MRHSGLVGVRHVRGSSGTGAKTADATVRPPVSRNVGSCPRNLGRGRPKVSVGKSCVRFKRLSDVDIGVLGELLRATAEHPPAGAV